jgi:hypothetical protein
MPPAAHIWVGPVFAAARRQPKDGKADRVMHKKQRQKIICKFVSVLSWVSPLLDGTGWAGHETQADTSVMRGAAIRLGGSSIARGLQAKAVRVRGIAVRRRNARCSQ